MKKRWCKQCQNYGHKKWLWLGTHRTHRFYLKQYIFRARWRAMREKS